MELSDHPVEENPVNIIRRVMWSLLSQCELKLELINCFDYFGIDVKRGVTFCDLLRPI